MEQKQRDENKYNEKWAYWYEYEYECRYWSEREYKHEYDEHESWQVWHHLHGIS